MARALLAVRLAELRDNIGMHSGLDNDRREWSCLRAVFGAAGAYRARLLGDAYSFQKVGRGLFRMSMAPHGPALQAASPSPLPTDSPCAHP